MTLPRARAITKIWHMAARTLIENNRDEFEELKSNYRLEYPTRRDVVRNKAQSKLVEIHHDEFQRLYEEFKVLENFQPRYLVYLERAKQMYIDGLDKRRFNLHIANWCDRYACKELRQAHKDEYMALVEQRRGRIKRQNIYAIASFELKKKHSLEYQRYYTELRLQIDEMIDGLKEAEKRFKD